MNGMKRLAVLLVVACAMIAQAETTLDYVQDGLIAHWDGIDNVARGTPHDGATTVWTDLIGGKNWTLGSNATVGENALTFSGTATKTACTTLSHENALDIFGSDGEKTVEIVLRTSSSQTATPSGVSLQTPVGCGVGFYAYYVAKTPEKCCFSFSHMGYDGCMAWSISDKNVLMNLSVGYRNLAVVSIYRDGENADRTLERQYVSANNNGMASSTSSVATLGSIYGSSGFAGDIYALRVYNRLLTAEEIAQNAAVDAARFERGDTSASDKLLVASTIPEAMGAVVSPAYGVSAAESKTCSVTSPYVASDGTAYVCTGWKLYSYDSSNHQWSTPIAGNGTSCAYEHTAGAYVKLEWQWTTEEALQVAELQSAGVLGTGGEIHLAKDGSGDVYHLFTTVGNYTFAPPAGGAEIRFLVVGGGGSSGGYGKSGYGTGGGGGGGVIANDNQSLLQVEEGEEISIQVGAGGAAAGSAQGINGGNSTLAYGTQVYTGVGGGGGGRGQQLASNAQGNGKDGGNGGGGGGYQTHPGGAGTQTDISGVVVGYAGGAGTSALGGAGGGGAGGEGQGSTGTNGGAGGNGVANDITGETVYYGGGGGGGCSVALNSYADATMYNHGGLGGGGNGALYNSIPVACRGEDGLGGGGGGAGACYSAVPYGSQGYSMAGGSGAVIIRYTPAGATGVDYLYVESEMDDALPAIPPAGRYKADDLEWPQTLIPGEQSAITGENWVCACVGYALETSDDCGKNWSAPITNAAISATINALDKSYRITWLWEMTYFNALIIENDLVGAPAAEPPVGSYLETELVFPMTLTPGEQTVVTGETAIYTCYGYELETSGDYGSTWSEPAAQVGTSVTLTGLAGLSQRYTWLWRESGYKVALGAAAEGTTVTISPARASGYYAIGETVTLTATSQDENKRFLAWTINGEVVSSEPTFEWVVEAAATIKAEFSGKWELVLGGALSTGYNVNNYLTDGNWEIPVQLVNAAFPKDLSTGSGNNSIWGRGYRKGRGELNFRSVEEDTGYRVAQLGNYSFACSSSSSKTGTGWDPLGCTNITAIIAPDVTNVCSDVINSEGTAISQVRRLVISSDAIFQGATFRNAKIEELEPRCFPNQTAIGGSMFQNCSQLSGGLSFPAVSGVLGQLAFSGCSKLQQIRFGGGAVAINYNNVFTGTSALTDLYFNAPFTTTSNVAIFGNKSVVLHCELNGEYADDWEDFLADQVSHSKVTLVESVEDQKAIAATYGVNWRAVVGTYLDGVNVCPIVDSSYKGGLILILK